MPVVADRILDTRFWISRIDIFCRFSETILFMPPDPPNMLEPEMIVLPVLCDEDRGERMESSSTWSSSVEDGESESGEM